MFNFNKNQNNNRQQDEEWRQEVITNKVEKICRREKISPDVGKIAVESCVKAVGKTVDVLQLIDSVAPDVTWLDHKANAEIPPDVLNESYLLIGPMGTGKSTIARELAKQTNMPKISLDDRGALAREYDYTSRRGFGTERRDAYITASVLSDLKEPTIVDFGAGDSVYDDPLIQYEMETLISRFKNVVLIMPSENRASSLDYLNNRVRGRGPSQVGFESDNGHFVYAPNNQRLATQTIYTDYGEKAPEAAAREITSPSGVE